MDLFIYNETYQVWIIHPMCICCCCGQCAIPHDQQESQPFLHHNSGALRLATHALMCKQPALYPATFRELSVPSLPRLLMPGLPVCGLVPESLSLTPEGGPPGWPARHRPGPNGPIKRTPTACAPGGQLASSCSHFGQAAASSRSLHWPRWSARAWWLP